MSLRKAAHMVRLKIKRIYDEPEDEDGLRVLVDRLWPRGLSKERASLDYWMKDISPSNELRKWYQHESGKWVEFKLRYFSELDMQGEQVALLRELIARHDVTLLYSSRASDINNATALAEYLESSIPS